MTPKQEALIAEIEECCRQLIQETKGRVAESRDQNALHYPVACRGSLAPNKWYWYQPLSNPRFWYAGITVASSLSPDKTEEINFPFLGFIDVENAHGEFRGPIPKPGDIPLPENEHA